MKYSPINSTTIVECRLIGFEVKKAVVFFICQIVLVSAVLRSSAQNGIGRHEQPVLSNLFLITNQNKCYLLFLIWAHKKKQTVAPSVRGTATTTKQPLLLLLRFQIIQSTLPYRCHQLRQGAKSGCFYMQAYGLESFLGISNNRENVNLQSIFRKIFIPFVNLEYFIYISS